MKTESTPFKEIYISNKKFSAFGYVIERSSDTVCDGKSQIEYSIIFYTYDKELMKILLGAIHKNTTLSIVIGHNKTFFNFDVKVISEKTNVGCEPYMTSYEFSVIVGHDKKPILEDDDYWQNKSREYHDKLLDIDVCAPTDEKDGFDSLVLLVTDLVCGIRKDLEQNEYRIDSEEPVYEWQWLYNYGGETMITKNHFTKEEVKKQILSAYIHTLEKYEPSKRIRK